MSISSILFNTVFDSLANVIRDRIFRDMRIRKEEIKMISANDMDVNHEPWTMNCELPDVQAGFRKGRGTRDQIASTSAGSLKKQESSRKTSISVLLTMPKSLTVWITTCGKFLKR